MSEIRNRKSVVGNDCNGNRSISISDFRLLVAVGATMRIAMVGTGYVGLVSAACLSEFGHHVVCVDSDSRKISDLDAGRLPIFEPGLEEMIGANVKARRLSFTSQL